MLREQRARNLAPPCRIRTAQEAKNNKPPRIKMIARIVSHSSAIYIATPTRRCVEPHFQGNPAERRGVPPGEVRMAGSLTPQPKHRTTLLSTHKSPSSH